MDSFVLLVKVVFPVITLKPKLSLRDNYDKELELDQRKVTFSIFQVSFI